MLVVACATALATPKAPTLPTVSNPWLRRAQRLGWAVLGLSLAHAATRYGVAAAVALAPNAAIAVPAFDRAPLPPALARHRVDDFRVEVGPPRAELSGWVVEPSAPARGTIVLLHGIRLDRRSLTDVGTAFADAGYRVVLADLRGHGASSGRYLTYGVTEASDISQLLDALARRGAPLGCVGAFGYSYGGAVAVELAARDPRVTSVVAVAPFASLREVVGDYRRRYLPWPLRSIPDAWFQSAVDQAGELAAFDPDATSPLRAAARSSARLLLLHGTADAQIPLRHSLALSQAAAPRSKLVPVPGATHASVLADASGVVRRSAVEWFERWLCPRSRQ
jgi:pimeloyl-ACP methyl ester carboxylesterase